MQLQSKLDAMKAQFVKNADPAILDAMGKASQQFDTAGMLSKVIKVGAKAPVFTLPDASGQEVSSDALRQKGPLLITLYRGVW
jgi:hypothetical protein